MPFEIHPQLLADCHRLGKSGDRHLLLHRNALVPWFIVVPETDTADLLDLSEPERNAAMATCAAVGCFIKDRWGLTKTNFAALGNVVPQLHLHVIGRSPTDSCWPKPIWGNLTQQTEYTREEIRNITLSLTSHLTAFHPDATSGALEICFPRHPA